MDERSEPSGVVSKRAVSVVHRPDSKRGANYAVMYRDTNGGQPVRIGEGNGLGLSSDGTWALAIMPSPSEIVFLPAGGG